jgi:hypothetical protein
MLSGGGVLPEDEDEGEGEALAMLFCAWLLLPDAWPAFAWAELFGDCAGFWALGDVFAMLGSPFCGVLLALAIDPVAGFSDGMAAFIDWRPLEAVRGLSAAGVVELFSFAATWFSAGVVAAAGSVAAVRSAAFAAGLAG